MANTVVLCCVYASLNSWSIVGTVERRLFQVMKADCVRVRLTRCKARTEIHR